MVVIMDTPVTNLRRFHLFLGCVNFFLSTVKLQNKEKKAALKEIKQSNQAKPYLKLIGVSFSFQFYFTECPEIKARSHTSLTDRYTNTFENTVKPTKYLKTRMIGWEKMKNKWFTKI